MEAILVTSFAEPSVTAFNMWGFWDGNHWLGNAPLYTRDWTLKPAGRVWMDYVFDRWWTSSNAVTGDDGSADVRAFKGEYDVTVSYGGQVRTERLSLLDDGEVVVDLDQIRVSSETAETLFDDEIRDVFPVQAEDVLHVEASLRTSSEVRFVLYDLLGRVVWSSGPMSLRQGLHILTFTPAVSASGTYLLRFYGSSNDTSSASSSVVVFLG